MPHITIDQALKMVSDVRAANPNMVAGWAVLPSDQYATSNELYEEIGKTFELSMSELRKLGIISNTSGGYGQNFSTYGFPFEIPNMEQLDCVFCYIDLTGSNFRYRTIFRYITNDEVEYATTIRIAFVPGNDRIERSSP